MKNKFLRFSCAALLALVSASARADIVTFNVSGTALDGYQSAPCVTNCAFAGTLTIDTTSGTVEAVDISFPAPLSPFNNHLPGAGGPYPSGTDYDLSGILNADRSDLLTLIFSTATDPGSLVGFDGGVFDGGQVNDISSGDIIYADLYGTITAPATSATPEPSSLILLGSGMLGFAGVLKRRMTQLFLGSAHTFSLTTNSDKTFSCVCK